MIDRRTKNLRWDFKVAYILGAAIVAAPIFVIILISFNEQEESL